MAADRSKDTIDFKIVSFNCNGLREKAKRSRIFKLCDINSYDVVFLQETHINTLTESQRWESEWPGKCFWSHGTSQSRGVGILFSKRFKPVVDSV